MQIIKTKDLMKDKRWRKSLQKVNLAAEISFSIQNLRFERGWSQKVMAKKVGTTQSGIARAENGVNIPSVRFLTKIAKATNTRLKIRFEKF